MKQIEDRMQKKFDFFSKEEISFLNKMIVNHLASSLKEKKRIEIRGFGSFDIRSRKYENKIEQYNTIYFRASKNFFNENDNN